MMGIHLHVSERMSFSVEVGKECILLIILGCLPALSETTDFENKLKVTE